MRMLAALRQPSYSGGSHWLHVRPRQFSTRNSWFESICEHFVPLEVEPVHYRAFYNVAAFEKLGSLLVSELTTAAQRVRRTRIQAERSDAASFKLSVQLSGRSQITQDGRSALLLPGSWGLYDTSRPYEVCVDEGAHFLVLHVPARILDLPDARIQPCVARRFDSCSGTGRVALDALHSLALQGPSISLQEAQELSAAVIQLFAFGLGLPSPAEPESGLGAVRRGQLHAILQYAQANLHDSALNATTLAQAFRISRRYLYKLFATEGLSPAEYLLQARLRHSCNLLRDPRHGGQIALLAQACGFSDASVFSHAFCRRYGLPPGAWRNQVLKAGVADADPG